MKRLTKGALGVAAMTAAGGAMADLPAGVETAITSLQTDGLLLIAAVTAVVVAFLGPEIIIKLVKRFSRKV
jgi:hypothetical protein